MDRISIFFFTPQLGIPDYHLSLISLNSLPLQSSLSINRMSSWMSYLTGAARTPARDSTREAIVNLREHLLMLEKKEDHLNKKIEDELRKAKANATTNKRGQSPFVQNRNQKVETDERNYSRYFSIESQEDVRS